MKRYTVSKNFEWLSTIYLTHGKNYESKILELASKISDLSGISWGCRISEEFWPKTRNQHEYAKNGALLTDFYRKFPLLDSSYDHFSWVKNVLWETPHRKHLSRNTLSTNCLISQRTNFKAHIPCIGIPNPGFRKTFSHYHLHWLRLRG